MTLRVDESNPDDVPYDAQLVQRIRDALTISPHTCRVCDEQYPCRPHTCEQCGNTMHYVQHICSSCDTTLQRICAIQQAERAIGDVQLAILDLCEWLPPLLHGVDHPDDILGLLHTALQPLVDRLSGATEVLRESNR